MKKIFIALLLLVSATTFAANKTGLLIIAHGSPSPKWNQPVLALEDSVKNLLSEKQIEGFDEVRVALMEFTEPSIAHVITDMEQKGVDKIYALPLFICLSGHSVYDVPSILGLYYNKEVGDALKEEGATIVNSKAQITVGPTLSYGDVVNQIMLDRVNELSSDPKNEALVVLAHGDDSFRPMWESVTNNAGKYILGKTDIEYYNNAFVEVGQSFAVDGVNAISVASEKKDKVIVIGVYLSMGPSRMVKGSGIMMMGHTLTGEKMLEGKNIVYSDKGLLPSPKVTEWIVDRASEWLNK